MQGDGNPPGQAMAANCKRTMTQRVMSRSYRFEPLYGFRPLLAFKAYHLSLEVKDKRQEHYVRLRLQVDGDMVKNR